MKRKLTLLAGCFILSLAGLCIIVSSRAAITAPPVPAGKEAEAVPKMTASKIVHVTVYPDSALVTREVEVPVGSGIMELVINPLPQATVASSLYTESADGIRVLTTRFRTRPVKEDTREEVRKLEEEIRKLQTQQRKLQAEMKAVEGNMALLNKLENFTTASTVSATEKGKLDSEATIALAKYLMEGRTEKTKVTTDLTEQMQTLTESLDFANRKLRNLTTGTSKIERDAVIIIDKVNNAQSKIQLNYLVSAAAWKPQYKFRAGKTTKDPVTVEYMAAIMQQTGEDWERVQMTLSTAQPMLNAAPPDLLALAVTVAPRGAPVAGLTVSGLQTGLGLAPGQPGVPGGGPSMGFGGGGFQGGGYGNQQTQVPNLEGKRLAIANPGEGAGKAKELAEAAKKLREQAQVIANLRAEKDANELANYAAVLDQVRDLVVTQKKAATGWSPSESKNEGPSVTYHLATKLSVPSRQDEQVIEVTKLDLDPEYFYKAVPVLSSNVYRQATLVNKSKSVLLPGEATMYNGMDFVGRMSLPLVAIGERFTVGFGAEPQLQVSRQMMDRSRTMQAGNQVLKYEYRILISSYKTEKVKLQIWDRLPLAEKEAMGVTLGKTMPELCKDPLYLREERANNLLRWDMEIDPEMRGEKAAKISYEFQLELDRQATLGSFQTK